MAKATVNGITLAESAETIKVEGNHYFPPNAVNSNYFKASDLQTTCGWKGVASYYHINIDDQMLENAAWYYPTPMDAASSIENYVAFYGSKVQIEE